MKSLLSLLNKKGKVVAPILIGSLFFGGCATEDKKNQENIPINNLPVVSSEPVKEVKACGKYQYQIDAKDSDGDTLEYFLTEKPSWINVDKKGLVTGDIPCVEKDTEYEVNVNISDGKDSIDHPWNILVKKENTPEIPVNPPQIPINNLPSITSSPITEIEECKYFNYQVEAVDQDNDVLQYSLPQKPSWLNVDSTGRVNGEVPCGIDADQTHPIKLNVSDGKDSVNQEWNLKIKKIIPANQLPEVTITRDFGEGLDGKVTYIITTNDPDGYAPTIMGYLNNQNNFTGLNPDAINPLTFGIKEPIIGGNNTLEAYAIDNNGASSQTISSSFYSPTESEARAKIEEILNARQAKGDFQSYIIDDSSLYQCPIENGIIKTIKVDYRIITNNNRSRMISYISSNDNANSELGNKYHIDQCNPNASLYMRLLPNEEIVSRTNSFIEKNVKSF